MDCLDELEQLAATEQTPKDGTDVAGIQRYQIVFGVSADEARAKLESHQQSLLGHRSINYASHSSEADRMIYLVKQEGPLTEESTIRDIIGSNEQLHIRRGKGTDANATFYELSAQAKKALCSWLAVKHSLFRPTIILVNKARKELSDATLGPFLGRDTTLPQFRPTAADCVPEPSKMDWPVWYFFYGKLAEPEQLKDLLGLVDEPSYHPASVFGARLRSWGGRYRAIVDGNVGDKVEGSAYLVESQEHEDTLRVFETNAYEVVRCSINMEDRIQAGLVFRYCGNAEALS